MILSEGEMVYKIVRELKDKNFNQLFLNYCITFSPENALRSLIGFKSDNALAVSKQQAKMYQISTSLLGYVSGLTGVVPHRGRRGVVGQEDHREYVKGYHVHWHTKDNIVYSNFEDETLLMPLRDIIIVSPQELYDGLQKHEKDNI